ncbi:MAG: hypothetical protein AAFQ84_13325 [Pseudomonadota bacterium]
MAVKGRIGLILAIAFSSTLACQGCTIIEPSAEFSARFDEAAPQSAGMRLAAPGYGSSYRAPTHSIDVYTPQALQPTLGDVNTASPLSGNMSVAPLSAPVESQSKARVDLRRGFLTEPLDLTQWSSRGELGVFAGDLNAQALTQPLREAQSFGAELTFAAPAEVTGLGVDLGFAPSAGYQKDGDFEARTLGAEFRVGRNFDQRGAPYDFESWYVFAGARGKALVWEGGATGFQSDVAETMALRDGASVGDLQAGLAMQGLGGHFSLSYIRREVEFTDRTSSVSLNENFAGLSFSLRN